jgi:hypothetical protein
MAVGRDRFRGDAAHVMGFLQQLQGAELDPDDPTSSYMLQARGGGGRHAAWGPQEHARGVSREGRKDGSFYAASALAHQPDAPAGGLQ